MRRQAPLNGTILMTDGHKILYSLAQLEKLYDGTSGSTNIYPDTHF
jgi:hypothetical protein